MPIRQKSSEVVFMAPGQGVKNWADGLELAKSWPKAEKIYDRVLKAVGIDVIAVCESLEDVNDPTVVQPASLAIGYARAEFLSTEVVEPDYLFGLSSGEFTVAAISGALSLEDAAISVKKRGQLQYEIAGGKGGAGLVMHRRGRRQAKRIKEVVSSVPGVHLANFHTPFKTGIGFANESKDEIVNALEQTRGVRGFRPVKNLDFAPHGPSVAEVQQLLDTFILGININRASIPIIANHTGRLMQTARTIRKNLIWQTSTPTKLNTGIANLIGGGVEDFYDLGPDDSMTKLLRDFNALHSIRIYPPISELSNPLQ